MAAIKFLLAVVLTEAITEILTKARLLEPIRQRVFDKIEEGNFFEWLNELMDCGYCVSVWVGWFIALLLFYDSNIVCKGVDWFFIGLIFHRLSNVLHFIIDRINRNHTKGE